MDEKINFFEQPMSLEEQIKLTAVLDDFFQLYENGFDRCLSGDVESDYDYLLFEFKDLFDVVAMLEKKC